MSYSAHLSEHLDAVLSALLEVAQRMFPLFGETDRPSAAGIQPIWPRRFFIWPRQSFLWAREVLFIPDVKKLNRLRGLDRMRFGQTMA